MVAVMMMHASASASIKCQARTTGVYDRADFRVAQSNRTTIRAFAKAPVISFSPLVGGARAVLVASKVVVVVVTVILFLCPRRWRTNNPEHTVKVCWTPRR